LQCVVVRRSVLQCVAGATTLQCVAVHCNVLQANRPSELEYTLEIHQIVVLPLLHLPSNPHPYNKHMIRMCMCVHIYLYMYIYICIMCVCVYMCV